MTSGEVQHPQGPSVSGGRGGDSQRSRAASASRALLLMVSLLFAGGAIARSFARWLLHRLPAHGVEFRTDGAVRLPGILAALPTLASSREPVMIALGASKMVLGFSPSRVEAGLAATGIHMAVYDLALPSLPPDVELRYAQRIRHEFEATGHRIAVSLIEIDAQVLTYAYRRSFGDEPVPWLKRCQLLSREDQLQLVATDPSQLASCAVTNAFGGVSSSILRSFTARMLGPRHGIAQLDAVLARNHDGWPALESFSDRGEHRALFPDTVELYRDAFLAHTDPARIARDGAEQFDAMELRIDPSLRAKLEAAVLELKACSDRVVLVVLPSSSEFYVRTTDGARRLQETLDHVVTMTGATLLDLDDRLPREAFIDDSHPNETVGVPLLATRLATDLGHILGASATP